MDEFDLMKELYAEPTEDELPAEDDEIQLNIRDYRSDDAFEQMLAELNGKYSAPKKPAAKTSGFTLRSEQTAPAEAEVQPAAEEHDVSEAAEQTSPGTVPAEPREAVAAMAEIAPPEPPPPPKPEVKRKQQPPKKTPEQLEKERRERERRAEQELFERREREAREREQQFIEKISNIWNTPEFAEGGRVEMNIRTDERKEIRINLPASVTQSEEQAAELDYTPLISQPSPEEEQKRLEEAARRDARSRTEKAASRKISIRKNRK